jgi:hypothetical protein
MIGVVTTSPSAAGAPERGAACGVGGRPGADHPRQRRDRLHHRPGGHRPFRPGPADRGRLAGGNVHQLQRVAPRSSRCKPNGDGAAGVRMGSTSGNRSTLRRTSGRPGRRATRGAGKDRVTSHQVEASGAGLVRARVIGVASARGAGVGSGSLCVRLYARDGTRLGVVPRVWPMSWGLLGSQKGDSCTHNRLELDREDSDDDRQ